MNQRNLGKTAILSFLVATSITACSANESSDSTQASSETTAPPATETPQHTSDAITPGYDDLSEQDQLDALYEFAIAEDAFPNSPSDQVGELIKDTAPGACLMMDQSLSYADENLQSVFAEASATGGEREALTLMYVGSWTECPEKAETVHNYFKSL